MPRDSANSITTDELLKAYTLGYFPMAAARDADHVIWVLPDQRGIVETAKIWAPRRLKRDLRQSSFEIRINTDFSGVISACQEETKERNET